MCISADGTVTGPPVHNHTQAEEIGPHRAQVQDLIDQAVEQVTKGAYSDTWAAAENQQNFMLRHGGEEVPRSEVRPGDVIYYEQSGENEAIEKGNTHHAASVTAVMPDGEIKYTQHSDSHQNVSLEGRMGAEEKAEGAQNIRIVRPHPDWY